MSANDDDPGHEEELEEIAQILTTTLTEIREQVRRIREELAQGGGAEDERADADPG